MSSLRDQKYSNEKYQTENVRREMPYIEYKYFVVHNSSRAQYSDAINIKNNTETLTLAITDSQLFLSRCLIYKLMM